MSHRPGAANLQACPAICSITKHHPRECSVAFASFKGHSSPLRHRTTVASCLFGGHMIWWLVDAPGPEEALELLPFFVSQRSTAVEVRNVQIP
jgi:hypothetical protein